MTIHNNNAVDGQALTFAEIRKITDEIAETEGPEAADAALRRMAREYREARESAVAPSGIEDLDRVLSDLEVGAGETAADVIGHLDELVAYAEDTAKAKTRETQELTPALIEQTCRTDGLNTATPTVQAVVVAEKAERTDIEDFDLDLGDLESLDACIEDTARAKAVEAMLAGLGDELDTSAKDTLKTEGSVAATAAAADGPNTATRAEAAVAEEAERTDIDLNLVLADLDVPAGEPRGEVIEHLDEPDASAEDAVEGAIAVAEAYEDQPDKPTVCTVEIQKYLAKQPKRGGARPAACKEFGIDPTDPLAEEKVRVAYILRKFKATLADLEAFWPGYWTLPRKTEGKDDKGEPFPSRALVLKKFEWRRYNEITSAERKKLKESARLKKRKAKIVAKGWRADFYDLSPADQKRERDRVWRQNKRTG